MKASKNLSVKKQCCSTLILISPRRCRQRSYGSSMVAERALSSEMPASMVERQMVDSRRTLLDVGDLFSWVRGQFH